MSGSGKTGDTEEKEKPMFSDSYCAQGVSVGGLQVRDGRAGFQVFPILY